MSKKKSESVQPCDWPFCNCDGDYHYPCYAEQPDKLYADIELLPEEKKAIASLKRLAKKWPKRLWLFAGSGGLTVLVGDEDGNHFHKGESIDQDYIVDHVDINADGGDF